MAEIMAKLKKLPFGLLKTINKTKFYVNKNIKCAPARTFLTSAKNTKNQKWRKTRKTGYFFAFGRRISRNAFHALYAS